MPRTKLYMVYVIKQNYYDGSCGDNGTTIVVNEFDEKEQAEKSCQDYNNCADKNYSYSVYPTRRSFPACFTCGGSGRERSERACRKCSKARKVWEAKK